jgi:hypothetical protein
MTDTIQTSIDSEASASPAIADAKNAQQRPGTAETGSPQTKTEPENAKPKRPGKRMQAYRVRLGKTRSDRANRDQPIASSPTVPKRQSGVPATQ